MRYEPDKKKKKGVNHILLIVSINYNETASPTFCYSESCIQIGIDLSLNLLIPLITLYELHSHMIIWIILG